MFLIASVITIADFKESYCIILSKNWILVVNAYQTLYFCRHYLWQESPVKCFLVVLN